MRKENLNTANLTLVEASSLVKNLLVSEGLNSEDYRITFEPYGEDSVGLYFEASNPFSSDKSLRNLYGEITEVPSGEIEAFFSAKEDVYDEEEFIDTVSVEADELRRVELIGVPVPIVLTLSKDGRKVEIYSEEDTILLDSYEGDEARRIFEEIDSFPTFENVPSNRFIEYFLKKNSEKFYVRKDYGDEGGFIRIGIYGTYLFAGYDYGRKSYLYFSPVEEEEGELGFFEEDKFLESLKKRGFEFSEEILEEFRKLVEETKNA